MDATYTVADSKRKEGSTNGKRLYNHVETKYKRLSPFLNLKSEKEGIACPQTLQEEVKKK